MKRTAMKSLPAFVSLGSCANIPGCERDAEAYEAGECRIIASKNHISVSCRDRYPTWDEIAEIKERLSDAESEWIMVLPKRSEYVNLHSTTLHIWSKEAMRAHWSGIELPEQA